MVIPRRSNVLAASLLSLAASAAPDGKLARPGFQRLGPFPEAAAQALLCPRQRISISAVAAEDATSYEVAGIPPFVLPIQHPAKRLTAMARGCGRVASCRTGRMDVSAENQAPLEAFVDCDAMVLEDDPVQWMVEASAELFRASCAHRLRTEESLDDALPSWTHAGCGTQWECHALSVRDFGCRSPADPEGVWWVASGPWNPAPDPREVGTLTPAQVARLDALRLDRAHLLDKRLEHPWRPAVILGPVGGLLLGVAAFAFLATNHARSDGSPNLEWPVAVTAVTGMVAALLGVLISFAGVAYNHDLETQASSLDDDAYDVAGHRGVEALSTPSGASDGTAP
jgi:hypothetical protein